MRPATIRRLLVFGVCLAGVGCLYLLPSMAGAPSRVGSTAARSDLPSATAPDTTLVTAFSAEPTATGGSNPTGQTTSSPGRTRDVGTTEGTGVDGQRSSTSTSGSRTGATAVEPGRDSSTPPEVGRLSVVTADAEHLVISWPEVDDDTLVGYEVWLNGFSVVTVQHSRARLAWFNGSDTHVIQVRALDAAGHKGPASPTLLVTRPTPPPEPTPSPASPSTAPSTTRPSTAPSSDEENADAAPGPTITAPSPTSAEAGGKEDRS